jgi:hypothetical protein
MMIGNIDLVRLDAFEGLCLTAKDLADEQTYHRHSLHRHTHYLLGYGIVQGLKVELEVKRKKYFAVIQAGYGITRMGQGVLLRDAAATPLQVPKDDGEYILWLFHVEGPTGDSRPKFDSTEEHTARIEESCAVKLLGASDEPLDAVALARINVRLGRLVHVKSPVPRAGAPRRKAESYLKHPVTEFIRLNRNVMQNLFRTALVKELALTALSFNGALVSSQFLLIEEGTSDRVLYRTAGSLITYAHDWYNELPKTIARVDKFTQFVRKVNAEIPGVDQPDDVWLKWFDKFERLLQPLGKISEELEKTVEARR